MAKKILIVEDDKMLCTIFQMFIQELDYELAGTVHTGTDALSAVEKDNDLDVILMDIHLDGKLSGIETACYLNKNGYEIPVIFITGDDNYSLIEEATLPNVFGFIVKPVYQRNLGTAIEFACAKFAKEKNRR
jgi:response regulator of citrate/malate metabolism